VTRLHTSMLHGTYRVKPPDHDDALLVMPRANDAKSLRDSSCGTRSEKTRCGFVEAYGLVPKKYKQASGGTGKSAAVG